MAELKGAGEATIHSSRLRQINFRPFKMFSRNNIKPRKKGNKSVEKEQKTNFSTYLLDVDIIFVAWMIFF